METAVLRQMFIVHVTYALLTANNDPFMQECAENSKTTDNMLLHLLILEVLHNWF